MLKEKLIVWNRDKYGWPENMLSANIDLWDKVEKVGNLIGLERKELKELLRHCGMRHKLIDGYQNRSLYFSQHCHVEII